MSKKLIDVYPYTWLAGKPLFLVLQRSDDVVYSGQWRMVGGKVNRAESRSKAALRELLEETGLHPRKFWSVPLINSFYEHQTDTIHHIAAFAAEVHKDQEIVLNYEHQNSEWIAREDLNTYLSWPRQIEILTWIDELLITNRIAQDWLIEIS